MNTKKDWATWHKRYDDTSSDLSARLDIVRTLIKRSLPNESVRDFRILDICAGDGRDLIPTLSDYAFQASINAKLIEIEPLLATKAIENAAAAKLANIEVLVDDAADVSLYQGFLPVNLILLCGVFGNVSNADVENIISKLPMFCKTGAKVIWTRNRREPDITPWIRELFAAAGFTELDFIAPKDNTYAVGLTEYSSKIQPLDIDQKLFTFIR